LRRALRTLLLVLACATAARAEIPRVSEPQRWGVGFMLGEPTGLNVKRWLGGSDAFDLGFGFALGPGVRFQADYLFGLARVPESSASVNIDVYLGVGPVVGIYSGTCGILAGDRCGGGAVYAGGRIPLGVEAVFKRTPVAVSFELAPGIVGATGGVAGLFDVALMARLLL
jgi:hypothetical protein